VTGESAFPQVADGKSHPLSFEQQTIYAIASLNPEALLNDLQNLYVMVRIQGPVRYERMQAAFDDVIARHAALRTRPAMLPNGEVVQEEFPEARQPMALSQEELGEGGMQRLLDRLAATPIPFHAPPLIRASLHRLGEGDHLLFLGVQHVACDVTGLYVALADLARAYQARVEGERLPPLEMGYGDYARWQAQHFADRLASDGSFWEKYFAGLEPYEVTQDLPFQPGPPGVVGAEVRMPILDAAAFDALQRWVVQHRTTMFVALLAAYHLALGSRLSSEERLSATYFDQRDHPATKEMVGFFLRPALIRSRLKPGDRMNEALGSMTRLAIEAHQRAYVPFLQVIAAYPAAIESLLGRSAPWIFLLQYMPQPEPGLLRFGDARGKIIRAGANGRQEPGMSLHLKRHQEGSLVSRVGYDPAHWRAASMQALAHEFARALKALMEHPSRTVAELAAAPGAW
jgi:hypothetical protein